LAEEAEVGMRHLISGVAAGLTALLLGTLIAGAADAARTAEATKQQETAQAIVADTSADQATVDATAYRAQLQQAISRLSAAYADLQARDAAYRDLLATSQANVERLQTANQSLQRQLAEATVRIQRAEAQIQAAQTATAPRRVEHDDD
jgi:chromosome segregation ATPase